MIFVYDVNIKRVGKVLKLARRYLTWVQNSVLEGEISNANYNKLKMEIKALIDESEDSCLFYTYRTKMYSKRESIGIEKGSQSVII